jgi:transposase
MLENVEGSSVMDYWDQAPQKRDQLVLFPTTLDSRIPEDHPVRLFDEVLQLQDWSEWEAKYNGRRGRPPIPPRVVAGVILYGLSRRVRSSRFLEYLVEHNLDFMWLVEGRSIDHSTLCEFRTDFQQPLKDLFKQIARCALTMGLARLNEVALDGTRVKANNGRFETLTAEGIEAQLHALDEQLEEMLQEAEEADSREQTLFDTGKSSTQLPPELAEAQKRQTLLKQALKKVQAANKARRSEGVDPKKNPAQVPTSDPDSRVLPNKEGGYAPNYTPIATTDVFGGFILDADVIASTTEHVTTLPSMDRIEENFGEHPEVALADGAHATGPNMEGMEDRGIAFFSHVPSAQNSDENPAKRADPSEPVEASQKEQLPVSPQTKRFDKSAFVYDEDKDEYYCPQGKPLVKAEKKSKVDAEGNRTYFDVYRCEECEGCPWSSDCRSEKAKRGRTVSRDEHAKRREQFAEKMSQPESKKAYSKRFHAAETPFGILKQVMNLRQFLLRGLEKVKTEWLWACTAFNLAKLVREIGRVRAELDQLMQMAEGEG